MALDGFRRPWLVSTLPDARPPECPLPGCPLAPLLLRKESRTSPQAADGVIWSNFKEDKQLNTVLSILLGARRKLIGESLV